MPKNQASAKLATPPIDVIRFKKPSGTVYGTVVATAVINNKLVRVGHAYLEQQEPRLLVTVPKSLSLDDLNEALKVLGDFALAVRAQHEQIPKT